MVSLDHINMTVEDLEKSLSFYEKLFDFKVVESGEHKGYPFAIIRNEDSMLCLYQAQGKEQPESSQTHKVYHFGLRVKDKNKWEEHLKNSGVTPSLVWDYPHSKSWYINDPTGHEIEVSYWHNNQIRFA